MSITPYEETPSQETRVCRLSTSLPPDTLTLVEFSGAEHVNDITVYTVRASTRTLVDVSAVLGKAMQINIVHPDQTERVVNLVCYAARTLGRIFDGFLYEFELRPWFWKMNYRINSRIFKDMSVTEILKSIFGEYGAGEDSGYQNKTTSSWPKLEYVVQYQESDLAFCRRLMEKVGINFHVDMKDNSHNLVMTSDGTSFTLVNPGRVIYAPHNRFRENMIVLASWETHAQVGSAGVRMVDYNYMTPTAKMDASKTLPGHAATPESEVLEYPGGFASDGEGDQMARRRIAGLRMHDTLVTVEAEHGFFAAGTVFNLAEHDYDIKQIGRYVVLSAKVHFSGNAYRSGSGGGGFHSSYILTREGNPISPARVTPRPHISGPQTAVVVEGAEIGETLGRVKVKFHWRHDQSSIHARVAQVWAGKGWGAVFIPRVGMEVVVEFIDGDPDRPLITGCVYNGDNKLPWDGKSQKYISGFKSASHSGGGYNEFSLQDEGGKEKIVTHAQHDLETTVENNETVEVNKDGVRKVHGTETVTVDGAFKMESFDSIELKVGGNSIKIDSQGVTIKALQVTIEATAKLATKGMMAEHKADGMMIIQAPIVNIN